MRDIQCDVGTMTVSWARHATPSVYSMSPSPRVVVINVGAGWIDNEATGSAVVDTGQCSPVSMMLKMY